MLSHSLVFPGDTVRRQMQTNGNGGAPRIYKNSFDAFRKIYQREGIKGYYRGLETAVIRTIPSAAIQFASYDLIKKWLGIHEH